MKKSNRYVFNPSYKKKKPILVTYNFIRSLSLIASTAVSLSEITYYLTWFKKCFSYGADPHWVMPQAPFPISHHSISSKHSINHMMTFNINLIKHSVNLFTAADSCNILHISNVVIPFKIHFQTSITDTNPICLGSNLCMRTPGGYDLPVWAGHVFIEVSWIHMVAWNMTKSLQ